MKFTILLLTAFLAGTGVSYCLGETPVTERDTALVAWWDFTPRDGGVVLDISGNDHHCALRKAIWAEGLIGGGVELNGGSEYVDCKTFDIAASSISSGSGGVINNGASALTLIAWINADDFGNTDARVITKSTSTAIEDHYWMLSTFRRNDVPLLRFRLKTRGIVKVLYASSGALKSREWTLVAAVYDGESMKLYKDGELVGSLANTGRVDVNASVPVIVGNSPTGFTNAFDGILDDVRVYKRALSQVEIRREYALLRNNPPVFESKPPVVAVEDAIYKYEVTVTDPENHPFQVQLALGPEGMKFEQGTLTWIPNNSQVGDNGVILKAVDSLGAISKQVFTIGVENVNDAPVIISSPPTSATQGLHYVYQVQAVDQDLSDVIYYQLESGPAGMTISNEGKVLWVPQISQVGDHSVKIIVNDIAQATDTQSYTVTVKSSNNAPEISTSALKYATEDVLYADTLRAVDSDGNNLLWFLLEGPELLTIDGNTGAISFLPDNSHTGVIHIKFYVSDGTLSDTAQLPLTVIPINDPPVISDSTPSSMVYFQDSLTLYPLVAHDEESVDLQWTVVDKPQNMIIASDTLKWRPDSTQIGFDTLMIIVYDGEKSDTILQLYLVMKGFPTVGNLGVNGPGLQSFDITAREAGSFIAFGYTLPDNVSSGMLSLYNLTGKRLFTHQVAGGGRGTFILNASQMGGAGQYIAILKTAASDHFRRILISAQ